MGCEHMNFRAMVKVGRLTASETDDTVVWYDAEITIECIECGKPFEFVGLPCGMSPFEPLCSVDGTEARMPIKPQGEDMPVKAEGLAGFKLRRVE
jgi:hypothetical protein